MPKPSSLTTLARPREARKPAGRAPGTPGAPDAVDDAGAGRVKGVAQRITERQAARGNLVERLRPGHEPGLKAHGAQAPDHFAVAPAEEARRPAGRARVSNIPKRVKTHLGNAKLAPIGGLGRRAAGQGRPETAGAGAAPSSQPGHPVREHGNHLAPDDTDRVGAFSDRKGAAIWVSQSGSTMMSSSTRTMSLA